MANQRRPAKRQTPHVRVDRPKCPHCKSTRLKPYAWRRATAELKALTGLIAMRYCRCLDCDGPVILDVY